MYVNDPHFEPDWYCPPGATILKAMRRKNYNNQDLADLIGLSLIEVRALLLGDLSINNELAERLSDRLGGSADFWRNRQNDFEESLERCLHRHDDDKLEEIARSLPLKEMKKFGWLNQSSNRKAQALSFFNVRSSEGWNEKYADRAKAVAFRQSTAFADNAGSTLS